MISIVMIHPQYRVCESQGKVRLASSLSSSKLCFLSGCHVTRVIHLGYVGLHLLPVGNGVPKCSVAYDLKVFKTDTVNQNLLEL